MTTHDARQSLWGHSVGIDVWDAENQIIQGHGWLTPTPVKGDILIIQGKKAPIHLKITKIRYVQNVDDMFWFDAEPVRFEADDE